jgi:hypothetical protein
LKITEGIVWEKNPEGQWIKTIDNWPANRRGARIVGDDDPPFGQYGKNEAIRMIEEWITKGPLSSDHYRLAVIPGKEMAPEDKEKLVQYNSKKKAERGEGPEPGPVESYISSEEQ